MQRTFSRHYFAAHAPSFLMFIDGMPESIMKKNTIGERSMLDFLQKHGFDRKWLERDGYGVSVLEDGSVTIVSNGDTINSRK